MEIEKPPLQEKVEQIDLTTQIVSEKPLILEGLDLHLDTTTVKSQPLDEKVEQKDLTQENLYSQIDSELPLTPTDLDLHLYTTTVKSQPPDEKVEQKDLPQEDLYSQTNSEKSLTPTDLALHLDTPTVKPQPPDEKVEQKELLPEVKAIDQMELEEIDEIDEIDENEDLNIIDINPIRIYPHPNNITSQDLITSLLPSKVYYARLDKYLPITIKFLELNNNDIFEDNILDINEEIETLTHISNPLVVSLLGKFIFNNNIYFVYEFVPYLSIRSIISSNPKMSWNDRLVYSLQLAITIYTLLKHDPPIYHRNININSVLIDVILKKALLADLGIGFVSSFPFIVQSFEEIENYYKAPELINRKEKILITDLDCSEIFSLSLVFYYLATNKYIRTKQITLQNLEQLFEKKSFPLNCPTDFRQLIIDCCTVEPLGRPSWDNIIERLHTLVFQYKNSWDEFPFFEEYFEKKDVLSTETISNTLYEEKLLFDNGYYNGSLLNGDRNGFGCFYYNNGDIYEGNWKDNLQNGHGNMKYQEGSRYVGEFIENQKKGFGNFFFANGDRFEGIFENNQMKCGVYFYSNGNRYEGEFLDYKKSGYGELFFANTDTYTGNFLNDLMHGHGLYKKVNGDYYEGDYIEGKRHGYGKLYTAGFGFYFGEFFDDRIKGKGVYNYLNGSRYEGEFLNEEKNGLGNFYFNNGDSFKGTYVNDQMEIGVYLYSNGNQYEGAFLNGKRNGIGKFYFSNVAIYDGEWKDDQMHGAGKFISGNIMYDGFYENNMKNGKGTFIDADGNKYVGDWKDDLKHGEGEFTDIGSKIIYTGIFENDIGKNCIQRSM